jgi:FMN phosphatase YigB (HAD superfamily)
VINLEGVQHSINDIEAIFFDVNGTLRTRERHAQTELAACQKILELIRRDSVPMLFWEELERRYKAYGVWAQANLIQLSEAEIWTKWLLPDEPKDLVAAHASELMLAWSQIKGRRIPIQGTEDVLKQLTARGYVLGMISNTMSTRDIPKFIEDHGWESYFQVVLLSAVEKSRKPAPALFEKAARLVKMDPVQCAYVGNKIAKDIAGCKGAGYSLGIVLDQEERSHPEPGKQETAPDVVINSLAELLKIFPGRV